MSSAQRLREFITERLTAAAQEIFAVFEKTVFEYEEEIERQRRLLDVRWTPEIKLQRIELQQQRVYTEQDDCQLEPAHSSNLDPDELDLSQVKHEQKAPCIGEESVQLVVKQEFDTVAYEENCDKQLLSQSSSVAHSVDASSKPADTRTDEGTFKHENHFHEHLTSQTSQRDGKPFTCNTCGKSFTYYCRLKTHIRVHTGERPCSCKTCGKSFRTNADVIAHTKRMHAFVKPYPCNSCGKTFIYLSMLKAHCRIHTGEKPYSCNTCERAFRTSTDLKEHVRRIHTGEEPHICNTWKTIHHRYPAGQS